MRRIFVLGLTIKMFQEYYFTRRQYLVFPQQQDFAMASLTQIRSGAASAPGSGQGSGGYVKFCCRWLGSGRFWCRAQVEVWKVPGGFREASRAEPR